MSTRGAFLATGAVAVLSLIGCQQPAQEQNPLPPVDERIAVPETRSFEPPAAIEDQVLSGELTDVDLEARTFMVRAEGFERVFTFSDATTVTGASGTQGLAAREGARVDLRYREENGARRAISVTLLE